MSERLNINQEDVALVKSVFKDNENLLLATRACMFGFELTSEEKELLRSTYSNERLMQVMHKKFLPTLDKNAQIGQESDVWLGVEQQVFGMNRDTIYQAVHYKKQAVEMTARALKALVNPDEVPVNLNFDPDVFIADDLQINLLARNQYIRHVAQQILFLKVIAEQKEPTDVELKKKQDQDSSK